jgi:glucosamine kinase
MAWKIGVDGGGTKTECVLLDPSGAVAARHLGPGCSPSLVGKEKAREVALDAIQAVRSGHPGIEVAATLLCMAGSRSFWRETAAAITGFGTVSTTDDSVPVLELATRGSPGLVLHAGTGSFVAARAADGSTHYAGGVGWRFGDEGSGYDLGRRAIARAALELQGWAPPSGLGPLVRARTGASTAPGVVGHYYSDPATNTGVAALAPDVLRLAHEGDAAAAAVVLGSISDLLGLALAVAGRLFAERKPAALRVGVSGPILNHPHAYQVLASRAPFALTPVTEPPIEGVRLLLARLGE